MYCINNKGDVISKEKKSMHTNMKNNTNTVNHNDATFKQMGLFSKQVIDKLIREKIPTTPENYAIYFEKLLEEKPASQRKNISTVLEAEEIHENTYVARIEHNVKDSFKQIKDILDTVSTMYNKINKLKVLTKTKKSELLKGSGQVALVAYEESLDETIEALQKQQTLLKERYADVSKNIKNFYQASIYDPKYDVYNKNYLLKLLDSEKTNVSNFNHESTVLVFKIKEESLSKIRLLRDKELITKTVANMIIKRSRRSDIIAHLGSNVFVIILKHTNQEQAQKVIENINNLIELSNYIVDSESIEISLEFGMARIAPNQTKEQIIALAMDNLK